MKRVLISSVAAGAVALLASAAHAAAPPAPEAELIQTDAYGEVVYFIPRAAPIRRGDVAELWTFGAEQEVQVFTEGRFIGIWSLMRFDCVARTVAITEGHAVREDLSIGFTKAHGDLPDPVVPATRNDVMMAFACTGQSPELTSLPIVSGVAAASLVARTAR